MGDSGTGLVIQPARLRATIALGSLLGSMALTRAANDSALGLAFTSRPVFVLAISAVAAFAALVPAPRWVRAATLVIAISLFGSAWWTLRTTAVPESLAALLAPARESMTIVTVRGRILDRPDASNHARGALAPYLSYTPQARFRLAVSHVLAGNSWTPAGGIFQVRVSGVDGVDRATITRDNGSPGAGDVIVATGIARPPPAPLNPGESDGVAWAVQEGSLGTLQVKDPRLILPDSDNSPAGPLYAALLRSRAAIAHAAKLALVGPQGSAPALSASPQGIRDNAARSLLLSLVLGADAVGEDQVLQRFTRLGVVHVLAISGYHVAVLALLASGVVRLIGDHPRLEALAVSIAVVVYTLIVPPSAPVLRASICVIAITAARLLGRRYDTVCVLLWTAFLLALWKPVEAFSLGYVLSIGLCILLVWKGDRFHARLLGPTIKGLLRPKASAWRSSRTWLARYCSATVLCWSISAPIIAWWTGWFSPIALLASLVIVPAVSVLLTAGLASVVIGSILHIALPSAEQGWSTAAGAILHPTARAILATADWLDHLPLGSLRVPTLALAWSVAATLLLLAWCTRLKRHSLAGWTATALLAAWLGIDAGLHWRSLSRGPACALRVDIPAVGDGLAVLLRAPSNAGTDAILIDAGGSRHDFGQRALPAAFRTDDAWRIPTVAVLGADVRHFVLLPDLIEPLSIERVLLPKELIAQAGEDPLSPQSGLLRLLEYRGVHIETIDAGTTVSLGRDLQVRFVRGDRALRAMVVETSQIASPLLLISHDAPAGPTTADAFIGAGQAATRTGIEQVSRDIHAQAFVLSDDGADAPAAPAGGTVTFHRTSTEGRITLRWDPQGVLTQERFTAQPTSVSRQDEKAAASPSPRPDAAHEPLRR